MKPPIDIKLTIGDRVLCMRTGRYAWVRRVLPGGAIVGCDGREWFLSSSEYSYEPPMPELAKRAEAVKMNGLDLFRDSADNRRNGHGKAARTLGPRNRP